MDTSDSAGMANKESDGDTFKATSIYACLIEFRQGKQSSVLIMMALLFSIFLQNDILNVQNLLLTCQSI